jgi:DNA-binding transcriptional LysR family regulator
MGTGMGTLGEERAVAVGGAAGALDWDDVRVLLALCRGRTLRAAASALRVNASTVGRRLDALEAALGTRLFDRLKDGLAPTAAAEQLLAHAERVEQAALSLVSAAEGFEREPEGVVRISALPGVADHFVAPALPRLLARFPRLRIELDASIAYSDLTRRQADLALRTQRPETGELVAVKLLERRETIVGSPGYLRELGVLQRAADARWLTWDHDLAHLPGARWLQERVPEHAIALRSSSINALLGAAEAGLGVMLLSERYARLRPLEPARMSATLARELQALPPIQLWLVGHRALREVPRIAAVWQFIMEEVGQDRRVS